MLIFFLHLKQIEFPRNKRHENFNIKHKWRKIEDDRKIKFELISDHFSEKFYSRVDTSEDPLRGKLQIIVEMSLLSGTHHRR